ncbi:MAG: hypothetical protein IT443_05200 [Phycisphaeraceae bacterium]|nr:hypothetical protein [Phycisphaeraceae bacterium]
MVSMRMKLRSAAMVAVSVFATGGWAGPYAPAAEEVGSTAVAMEDPAIRAWASGYLNYQVGSGVDAVWQTPAKGLGPAVGDSYDVVVLGAGGQITLTFDDPIGDGPGYDFAVFENAVTEDFLELAFVEASADGQNFLRFASASLTAGPVSSYGGVDPTDVDGLAGKYVQGYGMPFDLAALGLEKVTAVRLVDIVGDGMAKDSSGRSIYDPYPNYGSAGFDLDAVGVMNVWEGVPGIPGDFSGDGVVTLSDINPFKLALTDAAAFAAAYPEVDLQVVDPNGDGQITLSDINPFKTLLTGGGGVGAVIPEPVGVVWMGLTVLVICRRGRRGSRGEGS